MPCKRADVTVFALFAFFAVPRAFAGISDHPERANWGCHELRAWLPFHFPAIELSSFT